MNGRMDVEIGVKIDAGLVWRIVGGWMWKWMWGWMWGWMGG